MTMTLIKTVNDISYHVEDFNLENDENDFYFNISNITIQNGDYLFIPYYNGFEVSCQNCRLIKEFSLNTIKLENTKIYFKNGHENYVEKQNGMLRGIFKFSFPFFKINFYDEYNNLLILKENTEITFSVYDEDEKLEIGEYLFRIQRKKSI